MTSPEKDSPIERLHRPLFLWSLPFTFLYFGLPIISKEFGASALEIGGLFSVFTATTLILRPAVGLALDRLGAKFFLVAALCIYAAAMGVFSLAEDMTWLFAARIIQGVGSAFLWTSVYTLVAGFTSPEGRGQAMGRINETSTRGGLVGIFAAYFLMTWLSPGHGWTYAFAGFGALTLLGAILAWRTIPARGPAPEVPSAPARVSGRLIRLLIIVFILGIPEAMLSPIYLTYLQDKFTTSIESLAWAFFPAGVVVALFSTRLGSLSDRFGRIPMMAAGLAGAGVISILMPHTPSLLWLAVLYTLTSALWAIAEPAETALVADLTGENRRGAAYGLYDFVENLGFVVGPVLGGLVYDTLGRALPFYLNGAALVGGAILVLVLLRPTTRTSAAAERA